MKDNKPTKFYYAMTGHDDGATCFRFRSLKERTEVIEQCNLIPITAAEAMKRFGYTDSASRRVIESEQW